MSASFARRLPLLSACCLLPASIPAVAADYFNGKTVYARYCQSCHGERGQGYLPGTPDFSRGQSMMRSDAALIDSIANGRRAMPAFRGALTRDDIIDVTAYLRGLY